MKRYVAGFLFNNSDKNKPPKVALITKNRGPGNMAGRLNAIGGKVEEGESELQAMIREFKEETGADVESWSPFCTLSGNDWIVHFYKATNNIVDIQSVTDEKVGWYNAGTVLTSSKPFMKNLKWLLPLALDPDISHASVHDVVAQ